MGVQVEIPEIGTYVYITDNPGKLFEITQTETHQVRTGKVSTFRTFVTMLPVDDEGNQRDGDPIKADSSLITEM
jgi:hypothetical protein